MICCDVKEKPLKAQYRHLETKKTAISRLSLFIKAEREALFTIMSLNIKKYQIFIFQFVKVI